MGQRFVSLDRLSQAADILRNDPAGKALLPKIREHAITAMTLADLRTVWRLASHWYDGRLDPGYVRRDPEQAVEYLRGVGLIDPFWGTA